MIPRPSRPLSVLLLSAFIGNAYIRDWTGFDLIAWLGQINL